MFLSRICKTYRILKPTMSVNKYTKGEIDLENQTIVNDKTYLHSDKQTDMKSNIPAG